MVEISGKEVFDTNNGLSIYLTTKSRKVLHKVLTKGKFGFWDTSIYFQYTIKNDLRMLENPGFSFFIFCFYI